MMHKSDQSPNLVASPCIRNCCLDEQDICLGCYRRIEEITGWQQASENRKHAILAQCALRKVAAQNRRNSSNHRPQ